MDELRLAADPQHRDAATPTPRGTAAALTGQSAKSVAPRDPMRVRLSVPPSRDGDTASQPGVGVNAESTSGGAPASSTSTRPRRASLRRLRSARALGDSSITIGSVLASEVAADVAPRPPRPTKPAEASTGTAQPRASPLAARSQRSLTAGGGRRLGSASVASVDGLSALPSFDPRAPSTAPKPGQRGGSRRRKGPAHSPIRPPRRPQRARTAAAGPATMNAWAKTPTPKHRNYGRACTYGDAWHA